MKLRKYVEYHAHAINKLNQTQNISKKLVETIGHTLAQVVIGALIGISSTYIILQYIFPM